MNILMAHNRYQNSGGEDISVRMEVEMLRRNGCRVETFVDNNDRVSELGRLRTAMGSIWSPEAYRRVRAALRQDRFDLLHVQNFFPLISPSIYYAARAEGVPVVQSLRNYRLICPVGTLNRDGHVCESCIGRAMPWPAVLHACYRHSMLGSVAVGGMIAIHRQLGTWFHMVDAYIAMTEFMRDKFVQAGIPGRKDIRQIQLSCIPIRCPASTTATFALFVGRLSKEKGIGTLLKAWEIAGAADPAQGRGRRPLEVAFRRRKSAAARSSTSDGGTRRKSCS